MWPATVTRGDIAYNVSKLAMYLTNLIQDHIDAAVWCAEHLLHSKADGICMGGEQSSLQLESFVDASCADNTDDRRSMRGLVFTFSGDPIYWKSGRQFLIARSTTESEYIAMSVAARDAVTIRRLISEVLQKQHGAVTLYENNQTSN
jgi:hypothetical protein